MEMLMEMICRVHSITFVLTGPERHLIFYLVLIAIFMVEEWYLNFIYRKNGARVFVELKQHKEHEYRQDFNNIKYKFWRHLLHDQVDVSYNQFFEKF